MQFISPFHRVEYTVQVEMEQIPYELGHMRMDLRRRWMIGMEWELQHLINDRLPSKELLGLFCLID
jgi:hypothetical protein